MPAAVIAGELGAIRLPVEPPTSIQEGFPDRALDVLGAYFQAVVTAYAGDAWAVIAPNEPIVNRVFTHDPEYYDFKTTDLPALYLFRTGSARDPIDLADDEWRTHADTVQVFWLLPPGQQLSQPGRVRAISVVGKILDHALEVGRDPSWVMNGDPDPTAIEQGSVVLRHAGLVSAEGKQWKVARVAIANLQMSGVSRGLDLFDGLDLKITIEERARLMLGVDPEHPELGAFGGGHLTAPSALDLSVSVDDLTVAQALYLAGYGMLYVQDGATAQTIGTEPAALSAFTTAGLAAGVSLSASSDTVTIQDAGVYAIGLNLSAIGTAGRLAQFRLRRNNVEEAALQGLLSLDTTEVRSSSYYGFIACEANDELRVFAEADVDTTSLTVKSAQFTVERIR